MNNKKLQNRKKLYQQILGSVSLFFVFSMIIFLKDTSHIYEGSISDNNNQKLRYQQALSFGIPLFEDLLLSMLQNWEQNRQKMQIISNQGHQTQEIKEQELKYKQGLKYNVMITRYQRQLARKLFLMKDDKQVIKEQKQYYEQKYQISKYQQLPFCIVVSSYNNAKDDRYLNNIQSILRQEYKNYHIVFFDDFSDDNTGKLIQQLSLNLEISQQKLKIIINKERKMALFNFYQAAKFYCQPYEIFLIVDGDDELIGTQVFKLFNSIYQSRDLWVAYSNFLTSRQLQIGYSLPYTLQVIQNNLFRKAHFVISHLRTFYTKLLTLVKESDLKDENGNWFRAANDVAIYIPILEMAHKRIAYIPQISYIYNSSTGLNNHKTKYEQQSQNLKKIKAKNSYIQLKQLFTEEQIRKLKQNAGNL